MPRRSLEESIEHLRRELAEGDPLSGEDRALLDRTLAEVATRLDEDHEDDASLAESLSEAIAGPVYDELQDLSERIEKSRPSLSVILGRIVDSLSQLGI